MLFVQKMSIEKKFSLLKNIWEYEKILVSKTMGGMRQLKATAKQKEKKNFDIVILMRKIWARRWLYVMLIPFVAFFAIFVYKPMWGIQIAFKDYSVFKGMSGSPWVGLANFKSFFASPYAARVIRNTLLISLYSLAIAFPAPIIFALLLNEVRNAAFKKTVQTVSYLPYFISTVVVAAMVTSFLSPSNGIFNIIRDKLGLEKIYFLTQPQYFRTILITMQIWQGVGYGSVIYISALTSVDAQLYEACIIDGGGKWRQLIHVTIPGILPTVILMFIIRIGNIVNVGYEDIILLYQPSTYETADVIGSYVYRIGIEGNNFGLSTSIGLLQSVISLILVWASNMASRKISETSLW